MQTRTNAEPQTDANLQELRDRTVIENLPLVKAIAIRVHETLPVHVDLDDLIHAGVLGLFGAVEKYDASKSVSFQAYAKHRIKGAMLDSLRQLDWASRDLRKRQKQADEVTRDLSTKLGRTPADQERDYIAEFPATPEFRPDRMCERRQLRSTLDRAIAVLPERYQKVVFLYYTNDLTMKEIGDVLGVNESRISQIHKTALRRMAAALESEGIHSASAF